MKQTTVILILFGILIIATFLRVNQLTEIPPGLYPDEAMNGNNALTALKEKDFKVFYPENNGREGLFINLQAVSLRIFGNEPWALRSVSAIFGILTVLGLYFLGRELFSSPVGLLSSFFLATSFWHINFSRIGFRAIMAPFFLTWALYFFLRALHSKTFAINKQRMIITFSALSGLFLGLGMHSYIAYRIMPLVFLSFIPFCWRKKQFWISFSIVTVVSLAAAAPLFIYYVQNPADFLGRTSQVSIFNSQTPIKNLGENILKTAGMFFFAGDWNWRHNIAGAPQLYWPVAILFVIGTFLGLRKLWKSVFMKKFMKEFMKKDGAAQHNPIPSSPLPRASKFFIHDSTLSFSVLFLWILLAALPVVVSNEGIPHALRAIIMIPPIMILASVGGIWFYKIIVSIFCTKISIQKTKLSHGAEMRKKILNAWIYIVLSLLILQAYTSYFLIWGKNPHVKDAFSENYVALGRTLNKLSEETPKYVVINTGGVMVNGIPMPSQTVMFITDTFLPEKQFEKNIFYILPEHETQIPEKAAKFYLE